MKRFSWYLVGFGLLASLWLTSCIVVAPNPRRKEVRVWQRPNGCQVRLVTYRCYYSHGHLQWRTVRCPYQPPRKSRRVLRDDRCNRYH
jgi:hypothetical protein